MDNFDLKNYLANNVLLKEVEEDEEWDFTGYEYPQELRDMDKQVEELKRQFLELQSRLEAAKKARNKAKSDFTKTMPSLKDADEEYKNMNFSNFGKQSQYRFKKAVDMLKSISNKNGNNWDDLLKRLKSRFEGYLSYNTENDKGGKSIYVEGLFIIDTDESDRIKKYPNDYIKIGDWYVRPV
jgi:hypothetical protein